MIDEKRIAEMRQRVDDVPRRGWSADNNVSESEVRELVEVYEAARAYVRARRSYDSEIHMQAVYRLTDLFPEAPHG